MLPVGGRDRELRTGTTLARVGVQVVTGDEVFKGNREDLNPPASSDITWEREVYTLDVFHQFSAKLGAGFSIPYYEQDIENNVTGIENHASGVGDIGFYGLWAPWEEEAQHPRHDFLSLHNISIMAGVTIPTGDELEGEVPALHGYHLGSGSLEVKLSGRYDAPITPFMTLNAGATLIVDAGPDSSGFRYGNGFDLLLGGTLSPFPFLTLSGAVDAVVREKDRLSTITLPNTGGTWWFAIVGAAVSPTDGLFLEFLVAIPFYWNVNGTQPVSDEVWTVGILYRL